MAFQINIEETILMNKEVICRYIVEHQMRDVSCFVHAISIALVLERFDMWQLTSGRFLQYVLAYNLSKSRPNLDIVPVWKRIIPSNIYKYLRQRELGL